LSILSSGFAIWKPPVLLIFSTYNLNSKDGNVFTLKQRNEIQFRQNNFKVSKFHFQVAAVKISIFIGFQFNDRVVFSRFIRIEIHMRQIHRTAFLRKYFKSLPNREVSTSKDLSETHLLIYTPQALGVPKMRADFYPSTSSNFPLRFSDVA